MTTLEMLTRLECLLWKQHDEVGEFDCRGDDDVAEAVLFALYQTRDAISKLKQIRERVVAEQGSGDHGAP